MRFVGLILSLMILVGTGFLVWQDSASGSSLTVRAAPVATLADAPSRDA